MTLLEFLQFTLTEIAVFIYTNDELIVLEHINTVFKCPKNGVICTNVVFNIPLFCYSHMIGNWESTHEPEQQCAEFLAIPINHLNGLSFTMLEFFVV